MHSLFQDEPACELDENGALVALSLVPGVGPGRIRALLARFGSARAALCSSKEAIAAVPGLGSQTAEAVTGFKDYDLVARQFSVADRVAAKFITAWDPMFPENLTQIYDPPAFIWVRGELLDSDRTAVAIVGTRRATEYGLRIAREFASELAHRGFTIVSGLAHGIDAAAHRGALEAGGRTIAVLGSGVDRIYPSNHVSLARSIVQSGAVISEYPLQSAPEGPNFPRRNRIVSGLSLGVLVVEAHEKGGALITARLAIEQNREVFAIPSSLFSSAGTGCNRLIQRGHAKLVTSVDDIVEELGGDLSTAVPELEGDVGQILQLNEVELQLYNALDKNPVHIDTLCMQTGLDASTALVYLLSLEFKGVVRQMAGKQFFRL